MADECLICGAPLKYLEADENMQCSLCYKWETSKTCCVNGHYVCNECHTKGMGAIMSICLHSTSKNPIEIVQQMMDEPWCHLHGPEHHVMVGAALLAAYRNAGGDIDLETALHEMMSRGKKVPGGTCGFWGACGAGISTGMFVAIVTKSNPLAQKQWALSNEVTSQSLACIAEHGGPRCCKRDSFHAILSAIDFVAENLGVQMEKPNIICKYFPKNNQCLDENCVFNPRAVKAKQINSK